MCKVAMEERDIYQGHERETYIRATRERHAALERFLVLSRRRDISSRAERYRHATIKRDIHLSGPRERDMLV